MLAGYDTKKTKPQVAAQATPTTSQPWYAEFERYVQLVGIAERSQEVYLNWARQIDRHYPEQSTPDLAPGSVLDFLVHLQCGRKLAGSTVNGALRGEPE